MNKVGTTSGGDSSPSITATGKARRMYPQRLDGPWSQKRRRVASVLLLFYLVAPYVQVGGAPLLRLNFTENQLYLFGQTLRISDMRILIFFLLAAGIGLLWITSLRGRLWCGFACPQTVFLEWLIRPIEEWIEGNANRRQLQDVNLPWPLGLRLRKLAKHLVFLGIAAFISHGSLLYFAAPSTVFAWLSAGPQARLSVFIAVMTLTALLYFDFAWFRDQFCSLLCPYARFQSLMIDRQTPAIAYDVLRGEPRGKRGSDRGHCIDCQLCVRVCPVGIDIRQGPQLECIQCGRCADGCDRVMASLKRPLGLIRAASQQEMAGDSNTGMRIRVWLYGAMGLVALLAGIAAIGGRTALDVHVLRQPGPPYVELADGATANYFLFRFSNNSAVPLDLQLKTDESRLQLLCSACQVPLAPGKQLDALVVLEGRGMPLGTTPVVVRHLPSGQVFSLSFVAGSTRN